MARIQHSIAIERPISEVFAFITSLERIAEWQRGVIRSELRSGNRLSSGAQVVEVRQLLGREIEAPWEVTLYEPPYIRGFRMAEGPLQGEGAIRFATEGTGTRVTFEATLHGRGVLRLFESLISSLLQRQTARDFQTAKRILEQRSA